MTQAVEVGARFVRLVVLELISDKKNPRAKCVCDCGTICTPQRGALRNGRAKSCGCLRRELLLRAARTHGMSKKQIYAIWKGIVERCDSPKNKAYKNYGARGIKNEWGSFEEFYRDMGERPRGAWIERADNNGNYSKANCKWVTPKENSLNKRTSKYWFVNGERYESSVEAAADLGVNPSVIVRGCNGYWRRGKWYPPRKGWSCGFKYELEIAA